MAGSKDYEKKNDSNRFVLEDEDQAVWNAVARKEDEEPERGPQDEHNPPVKKPSQYKGFDKKMPKSNIEFGGKSIMRGSFSKENLENANFSAANLIGANLSGANLRNVDFSGADLSGANLSGADLSGAILAGAVLHETNFTGAKLHNVKLHDADLENAILLDIDIDDVTLEELQELVEYLAKYYPHKLNLTRINLTLLDLKRVDLSKISLRGVDFTGVDFTGVNIMELDLSESIITPQQIAQALGRVPNVEELKKILAPKKTKGKGFEGLDFDKLFFDDGREFGTWDFTKDKGMSIEKMLKAGKKVFRSPNAKPPVKEDEILEKIRRERENEEKNNNRELRELIEQRKREELEARREKKREQEKNDSASREIDKDIFKDDMHRDQMISSRGGNER
ncbi:MAG: pentapeptide repeat-containing protein [Lactobacillaceae bacterium]|jgi:uncharacterized protein YjbI with pentapeptide repeats|nr:pentapeptide repeat-containing protein [Lactobacillaceae bacterium]